MGVVKAYAQCEEEKREAAIEIAVEAGALERCLGHDYVLNVGGDERAAYKLANALFNRNDPRVALFDGDRHALTEMIKSVLDDHWSECPGCAAAQRG